MLHTLFLLGISVFYIIYTFSRIYCIGTLPSSLSCSTLGRIIKVSPEVLAYREWTIRKWGLKQYAKLENHGNVILDIVSSEYKRQRI